MSWIQVGNTGWEYNDNPPLPNDVSQILLWVLSIDGIRTNRDGTEIYTKCRRIGSTVDTMGELNKTYYDCNIGE